MDTTQDFIVMWRLWILEQIDACVDDKVGGELQEGRDGDSRDS